MTHKILLVHGACHGAWCWEKVTPILRGRGHHVLAIDLPGRGGQGRPGWGPSLASYALAVTKAAQDLGSPVVALGHSMGGQMISAAAEQAPELFERLVYLSAFLPIDGDSIVSFASHNQGSGLASATRVKPFKGQLEIVADAAAAVFYGDCDAQDVADALARLTPESLRPSAARIRLSADRYGRVPRSYIRLTEDRAITPHLQDYMLGRQACERVISLKASHSPFLSQPDALAAAIEAALV